MKTLIYDTHVRRSEIFKICSSVDLKIKSLKIKVIFQTIWQESWTEVAIFGQRLILDYYQLKIWIFKSLRFFNKGQFLRCINKVSKTRKKSLLFLNKDIKKWWTH